MITAFNTCFTYLFTCLHLAVIAFDYILLDLISHQLSQKAQDTLF